MTLREFFQLLAQHPAWILVFFLMIPFTAFLAGTLGKDEGHLSPWKQLYSVLIYLVCVPGIFAVTLSVYLFLFEKRSIFDTDIYTQVLPILSMVGTLLIIRKNVAFDHIPGFGKIWGLIWMIAAVLVLMWFVDRTHIYAISFLPFHYVLIIFALMLLLIRFGWSRMFKNDEM